MIYLSKSIVLCRDDRCISDHGREVWFPYLDEDLVSFLQSQPLQHLVDLSLPQGKGDKLILRRSAKALGLVEGALLVKRAIQFGSLAAKQTSEQYFGSRRKGKGQDKIG
jgi:asparagine synthetase B (glutamine-hydrolysing)